MPFFDFSPNRNQEVVLPAFWIYWVITIPLTGMILFFWLHINGGIQQACGCDVSRLGTWSGLKGRTYSSKMFDLEKMEWCLTILYGRSIHYGFQKVCHTLYLIHCLSWPVLLLGPIGFKSWQFRPLTTLAAATLLSAKISEMSWSIFRSFLDVPMRPVEMALKLLLWHIYSSKMCVRNLL